ncbi:MAG: hypothetical protein KIT83_20175 [Bryobacterales bacterium]|nr:hypothetical protein [Bryobacterales bacterium]
MNQLTIIGDRLRATLIGLVNKFSVCSHRRTTLPMSSATDNSTRAEQAASGEMLIVCLDCGRRFPYGWKTMCIDKKRAG